MARLVDWLDERTGLRTVGRVLFLRKIPRGAGWLYTLGFATLFVFLVQVATGTVLALFYAPSPDHAYESVAFIQNTLPFGSVLRGLHHWGASAMIVLAGLHLATVFVLGAYKRPRELTWLAGVVLLLVVIGLGFTGYLLPWDEKAYWATTVGTNMAGTVPVLGDTLLRTIRGGAEVGAVTLTRFYGMHILILPGLFALVVAVHLYLVIYLGVSVPPWLWQPRAGELPGDDAARYETFKRQGRPFWPDLIVEDAVVSLVVFLVLAILVAVAGVPLEARADPAHTSYVPRPEWYFLALFQLLKYFPGQLEWVGVIGIPLVLILVLFLLPFYDRRAQRRPERRPVALTLGTLVIIGMAGLTIAAAVTTPPSTAVERGIQLSAGQVVGRSLYLGNCSSCHGDAGQGTKDGPSLAQVGALRDPAFIHRYIEDAKALNSAAKMPEFIPPPGGGAQVLTHEQVEDITQYLLTFR
jgi:ubiquinol-cytochrome c reductase cytochrome b subunit